MAPIHPKLGQRCAPCAPLCWHMCWDEKTAPEPPSLHKATLGDTRGHGTRTESLEEATGQPAPALWQHPGVPPPWPRAASPFAGVIWGGLSHICPRGWGQRGGHISKGPAHLQVLKLLLLLLEHLELLQHRVLLKLPPVHLGKDAGGCQRPQAPSVPCLSPHREAAWPHVAGGEPHACHRPHGTETWAATTWIKGLARGHSSGAVAEGSGAGWLPKSRGYTLGFSPPLCLGLKRPG